MTRHFGVLIPSTNTTVEMECRLLPMTYQAHVERLKSSGTGSFAPSRDEDIDYQSGLLGTAKVEMVILAQTSASLFVDDYDDVVTKRMSVGAGVPAITSAQAVGRAVRALGARRIAIVSPYSDAVNERAARYFATKHGLDTVALDLHRGRPRESRAMSGPPPRPPRAAKRGSRGSSRARPRRRGALWSSRVADPGSLAAGRLPPRARGRQPDTCLRWRWDWWQTGCSRRRHG
jgi:Arylmalonate decarboxylase